MVLEFLDGQTLRGISRERGLLPAEELLEILDSVASVLDAAHARGIVHRDLKPENIMVTRKGGASVVKVLDLGVAKLLDMAKSLMGGADGRGTITTMGEIMGTPVYMSPEQWGIVPRDGNHEVDGRTDVYSLGVMVYELTSGERPFSGANLSDVRREHQTRIPRPLDEVIPGVPRAFGRAVAKAMAKDRADRYQTAGEFLRDLHAAMDVDEQRSSDHVETISRDGAVASKPRSPAFKIAAGALVGILVIVTAALYWGTGSSPTPGPLSASVTSAAHRTEVIRFGIELEPLDGSARTVSTTSRNPVAPERRFYFRFVPQNSGFVYILCPLGDRNVLGTILTGHGAENAAEAGKEFVFPRRGGIGLSAESLTTTFTVIFSPEPLTSPAFLSRPAGHALSAREQKELADLRAKHGGSALEIVPVEGDVDESVTLPEGVSGAQPIVFEIPMHIVPEDSSEVN
jgi:serine/threonine protein kinase